MHDVLTVAVVYRGENLFDDVRSILLTKYLLLCDAFEKLPSVAQPSSKTEDVIQTCHEIQKWPRPGFAAETYSVTKK